MITQIKLLIGLSVFCAAVQAETVNIYAAASMTDALNAVAKRFNQAHPQVKIVPVFAASSTLAKQIEAGAPADLYISADQDWVQYLVNKQRIQPKFVQQRLANDLVVIAQKQQHIQFKPTSKFNFAQAFKGYLCTGQMESVPAGKYAKQSLIHFNWLNSLSNRIVGTDDVRATLAFVERGECQVGIVYKTDALLSQKVKIVGTFPAESHNKIIYPIALTDLGEKNPDAEKFFRYLNQHGDAKKIFLNYGFRVI